MLVHTGSAIGTLASHHLNDKSKQTNKQINKSMGWDAEKLTLNLIERTTLNRLFALKNSPLWLDWNNTVKNSLSKSLYNNFKKGIDHVLSVVFNQY